ncbi:NAD(P)/FAD-dependent oxidoreductase [Notoacmeibacter ruber]|uniref:NAD(P)/FAD-dependent oxidoreductase n=1 Tax=Notoacmeibacter ruber TaxID=2670375 RepID=UPI001FE1EC08|nr:FAD-binding oxidoreductase [Notoacmeibacter ruber]
MVGLWAARFASEQGLSVILIERDHIGAGASGGVLGALMPHQPHPWNLKKQKQFDALVELGSLCAVLESETGLATGYRRAGRLMPIATEEQRERQTHWSGAAAQNWRSDAGVAWRVEQTEAPDGLLSASATRFGYAFDNLSAIVSPRKLLAALRASVEPSVTILEGCEAGQWSSAGEVLKTSSGEIGVKRILVSAGANSTSALHALGLDRTATPHIVGIKGQGALIRPADPVPEDMPMIYGDGLYLVPHADGTIGLGSTTEKSWQHAFETDGKLDELLGKAKTLCPWLEGATVLERWAHLRPKGPTANPLVERVREYAVVASGGYKTGLAFAPTMAREAIAMLV